ncbi:tetratricopeptide repeat protein [Muricauda oceani]|uniref:Tetratricopeptide repeat protein n=1 Tax=Flagellimonas oceani TaxID=2698672 RepID=A0A6G7IZH5_9FLAO|nr:tetratricopeptide repeat protein [Allomuricauda oceani]MBW8244712.1 tetratricopeptide repeat protein [Allomuricauda oceani]QII43647.1 tetratricopeptide repeat protein [Allomuricauda oceani]
MKHLLILSLLLLGFGLNAQVNPKYHKVKAYTRSDGTYVPSHYRTNRNSTNRDNYTTKPNINPHTGSRGYIEPDNNYLSYPSTYYNSSKKNSATTGSNNYQNTRNFNSTDYISYDTNESYKNRHLELFQYNEALMIRNVNAAVDENNQGNYNRAGGLLVRAFQYSAGLEKIYLYYAASSYVNGGNYEMALKYYLISIDKGISSLEKKQRQEIYKNSAIIYYRLGEFKEAIKYFKIAKKENPRDINLILNEANCYHKLGNKYKFKSLMEEAVKIDNNNPDLWYNIGVINMEQGNLQEARKAYKRALEINPSYLNAIINLSTTYINEGNLLIDEMNALGSSRNDIRRFDELRLQKDKLFGKGADILESYLRLNSGDRSVIYQLKSIYGAMGDRKNYERLEKM